MSVFFNSLLTRLLLLIIDNAYTLSYYSIINHFDWNQRKNEELKKLRGIDFEEIVTALKHTEFFEVQAHYNKVKYGHQQILFIEVKNFIYLVPFVTSDNKIFLKTLFRSKKFTKLLIK
jgi:uncharacterized DUF497 family protein